MLTKPARTSTTIYPLFLNIFPFPELINSLYFLPGKSTDRLGLTEILKSLLFKISVSVSAILYSVLK